MHDAARPVLHLIDSAGFYGAERVLLTLLEQMRDSPFPGILGSVREDAAACPEVARRAAALGLPVVHVTLRRGFTLQGRGALWSCIKERGAAVVHSHGYKTDILLGLLRRRGARPFLVSTVHGWAGPAMGWKLKLYQRLDLHALGRFDAVVAVSETMRRSLQKRIRRGRIDTIYNGIPLGVQGGSAAARRTDPDRDRARPATIGFLGRLEEVKGPGWLLETLPELLSQCRCRLLYAGDGPLRRALEERARALGIAGDVEFLGFVGDSGAFLRRIDLLVMPSLSEGLPMTLLEAATREVPIVATAVGGIPEVIEHGRSGILVPPGDARALAGAIRRVLVDREEARALAVAAADVVRSRFGAPLMARRYAAIYGRLLGAEAA